MKVIHISSYKWSVGATFMDWSLKWLSGQTKHYSESIVQPLTDSPLKGKTSHNHPVVYTQMKCLPGVDFHVDNIKKLNHNLLIVYMSPHHDQDNILAECERRGYRGVYIDFRGPSMFTLLDRANHSSIGIWLPSEFESRKSFMRYQYNTEGWELDHIWEWREFFALNMRPYGDFEKFNITNCYSITNENWFFYGDKYIKEILDYVGLTLDPSRWDHWLTTYKEWSKTFVQMYKFIDSVEAICKHIVDGDDFDITNITKSELSFTQESIIQHILIYRYGLNLKSWQLEKFPMNTKELYNLLEPNIHSVEDIYGSSTKA